MLKNWSRIALASVLVLMLGAVVANATTSRVHSLANVGDYISDDSAVNRWYSTLVSFANQVNAEMGDWANGLSDTRGLGWNLACGEDGKYGTYRISLNEGAVSENGFWAGNRFFQDHSPQENSFPFAGDLEAPYTTTPLNRWDIAGAWEIGETFALGVSITESKWFIDDTETPAGATLESDNSWMTLGVGGTWTNNENMVLDVLVNFGSAGGSTTTTLGGASSKLEWDSKTAFEIAGRLFYDWKDNVTLVPVIDFTSSEYSQTNTAAPIAAPLGTPNGQKTTDFLIGLGLNMDVNQDNMLVFALEWANRSTEFVNYTSPSDTNEVKTASINILPAFRLALESHITSWLTTRIGAAKYISTTSWENQDGDEIKESPGAPTATSFFDSDGFDWFLGCGFNIAEWTVDLELAEETPFGLGYWLTGYSGAWSSTGPVGRISAVYNY